MTTPIVYSHGSGVQSTAMAVLVAQGFLDRGPFLFSNVGDDSEDPETLVYFREVFRPWAADQGIEVHELGRDPRRGRYKGERLTLYRQLMEPESRSLPIPVRMANGAPGRRSCTADYKIRVVQRWLLANGASEETPWRTAVGISTDEFGRATSRKREPYEVLEYPLLSLPWRDRIGLSRNDCEDVIRSAGLPVPPKSSCYFCPFHRPSVWAEMRRDRPHLFDKAADLEDTLNERREKLGKDRVYLTRFARPLREAITEAPADLFGAGWDEDEGYRCGDVCDT